MQMFKNICIIFAYSWCQFWQKKTTLNVLKMSKACPKLHLLDLLANTSKINYKNDQWCSQSKN